MVGWQTSDIETARRRLSRELFPSLARELDIALRTGSGNGESSAQRIDAWLTSKGDWLREAVGRDAVLAEVTSSESRDAFDESFRLGELVLEASGVTLPTPEQFVSAGFDFSQLAKLHLEDPTLQLVPAPHGLGAAWWRETAMRVAASFPKLLHGPALSFSAEIEREFSLLDLAETDAGGRGGPQTQPGPRMVDKELGRPVIWTLRLIPASDTPPLLGLSFTHGPHLTLPEMLMLQLMRVCGGRSPVDAQTFTWIAGTLSDGRLAARHVFDKAEGVLRFSSREPGQQGPHQGARPPVP